MRYITCLLWLPVLLFFKPIFDGCNTSNYHGFLITLPLTGNGKLSWTSPYEHVVTTCMVIGHQHMMVIQLFDKDCDSHLCIMNPIRQSITLSTTDIDNGSCVWVYPWGSPKTQPRMIMFTNHLRVTSEDTSAGLTLHVLVGCATKVFDPRSRWDCREAVAWRGSPKWEIHG